MALENPITSDDLTINFATLLDLSVRDRVQAAAADTGFAQALMASLTPIQMAKAFPDYYRKELPDISNFILANRYLDSGGRFDQYGGGDPGKDKEFYHGETAIPAGQNPTGVPEPSIEEMQAKLLEKGIDVNKTYDAIANGLSADDPQVQFLKNISADKLAAMGIEQFKSDDGTLMYRKAPELSDQEVSNKISGKFVAKENASEKQKAVIEFASRWNISPQAAAGVLNIESGVTSDIAGGANGNYHGVFQLQTEQIPGLTEKAGFGSLTPSQYRKLSVADQLKVMDEYYKQAGVTPEFFTGDPQTDASKMWALQLAPGNAKRIDYNNPNAVISNTDQASTIEAQNNLVTVGSAGSGSIAGGEQFLGDSFTRIEGTASSEQIAEFRNQQQKTQKEAFIREKFHQASPTSSEVLGVTSTKTASELIGGTQEVTATQVGSTSTLEERSKGIPIEDIDTRLKVVGDAAIRAFEQQNPGYKIRIISGERPGATTQSGNLSKHALGHAIDYEIVGPDGRALPSLGDPTHPSGMGVGSSVGDYSPKYFQLMQMMEAARVNMSAKDSSYADMGRISPGIFFKGGAWMDSMHASFGEGGALGDVYGGFKDPEQLIKEGTDPQIVEAVKRAIAAGAPVQGSGKSLNEADMQKYAEIMYETGVKPEEIANLKPKTSEQTSSVNTASVTPVGPVGGPEEAPKFATDTSQKVIEPTETASATPVAPVGGPEEVRKFRTGGSPDVQDDENLSVFDEDGSLKWKMNSGEGIYVKPKDNEYADDKMDELSGRIDELDDKMGSPAPEKNKPKTAPDKAGARPDKNWQQDASTVTYSIGSQNRAFKRTKFQNEGFHFNRSAPNSISS